jgi:Luciferase-like monooxygenase
MRFAISIPQHVPDGTFEPATLRAYLSRAESLGFHSAWTQEAVLSSAPLVARLELMAFAAACTERLRLGCAVFVSPLHNPVHLAKSISTLDQLSRGRIEVGLGIGGGGRTQGDLRTCWLACHGGLRPTLSLHQRAARGRAGGSRTHPTPPALRRRRADGALGRRSHRQRAERVSRPGNGREANVTSYPIPGLDRLASTQPLGAERLDLDALETGWHDPTRTP